jgi:hypothetical protein
VLSGLGVHERLLALALLALALVVIAGLVLVAYAVLAGTAMPLVGSVCRLDLLAPGSFGASGSTPRTSRPGCWGLAAWWACGQRRPTSRCGHRPAGPSVIHRQTEPNADERP